MGSKTQRIDIRVPQNLLTRIETYQKNQGIANRTTALLELARIGLDQVEEKKKLLNQ